MMTYTTILTTSIIQERLGGGYLDRECVENWINEYEIDLDDLEMESVNHINELIYNIFLNIHSKFVEETKDELEAEKSQLEYSDFISWELERIAEIEELIYLLEEAEPNIYVNYLDSGIDCYTNGQIQELYEWWDQSY